MANLRDIRNRISSVNNTQQITKAMKMVAAAKLRKAQQKMVSTRPFANKIRGVVSRLISNNASENPILRKPEEFDRILLVVVGSDKGLCGGFNNNLFKEIESNLKKNYNNHLENSTLDLITIGRKAGAYFKKRKYQIVDSHPGFFDNIEYGKVSDIMTGAIDDFTEEKYDRVLIAYNEFKTVITQIRAVEQVLPVEPDKIADAEDNESIGITDYIYEPNPVHILDKILPVYLIMQLWKAVLDSNAAEQGARMVAMDNATENAKELEQELKLKYNQLRQSAITTEISEIVSGAQALEEN